jgi:hypothetical protein
MSEIRWERRGMIRVPVVEDEPTKTLCKVCGCPSPVGLCRPCRDSQRVRVHGSHSGFNQHQRRNELPCLACSDAERVYQGKRYRKGSLSAVDREWAQKNAVKSSWELDTRTNRGLDKSCKVC